MPTSSNRKTGNLTPHVTPPVKYIDSPGFQSFYTNNIAYGLTQMDFVLIFGEIMDKENDQVIVERRARITMTPVQAKVLRGILNAQIKMFEEKLGKPIELPSGVTDDFTEAKAIEG